MPVEGLLVPRAVRADRSVDQVPRRVLAKTAIACWLVDIGRNEAGHQASQRHALYFAVDQFVGCGEIVGDLLQIAPTAAAFVTNRIQLMLEALQDVCAVSAYESLLVLWQVLQVSNQLFQSLHSVDLPIVVA